MNRLPVVIIGTNCLSGVTTWAEHLRATLADHPRYDVRLLHIGDRGAGEQNILVPDVESAYKAVRDMAPLILLPNYMWDLYLAGFEPGISCLGMCHADSDEQYYRPLSWYEPMISHFVGVSPECSAHIKQRLSFRADDVTTLPYGIPVPRTLHRDYRVDPLRIVYAGRVTQLQKRVMDFVPLVESLRRTGIRFVFNIVGDGDHLEPLQAAIESRVPHGYVRFHGRRPYDEMPDMWAAHDVFVQTSDFEGTSISLLEAMAYGVAPVVTAASSGISGVIHEGETGFIVPVGDMEAMAQAIARLAAVPQRLAAVGAAARVAAQEYSLERYGQKFVRVLDRIAQAPKHVNIYERYGMFAGSHPMLKQGRIIDQLQSRIAYLEQGPIKRLAAKLLGQKRSNQLRIAGRVPGAVWQQKNKAA